MRAPVCEAFVREHDSAGNTEGHRHGEQAEDEPPACELQTRGLNPAADARRSKGEEQ